jgi:LDH2 family malate/lactate/ureidoglycolate dehydrogenase
MSGTNPVNGGAAARFDVAELADFGAALLRAVGLDADKARDVAEVLVEGDLLGHDTHGLHLLGGYLGELEKGTMTANGDPGVIAERSSVATWDGRRLPGPWLVRRALAWAAPRAREHGTATVAIRRSHHIACLAAYLEQPARDGLMVVIASSDPAVGSVAPFGGTQPVFTPNPMAVGIPASAGPVMIDISASSWQSPPSDRRAPAARDRRPASAVPTRGGSMPRAGRATTRPCCSPTRRARSCRWAGSMRVTRATGWR